MANAASLETSQHEAGSKKACRDDIEVRPPTFTRINTATASNVIQKRRRTIAEIGMDARRKSSKGDGRRLWDTAGGATNATKSRLSVGDIFGGRRRSSSRSGLAAGLTGKNATLSVSRHNSLTDDIDARVDQKKKLLKKFKFWANFGILLIRMHKHYMHIFDRSHHCYKEQLHDIDQAAALGIQTKNDLFFDPALYKANRQMRVSAEAKRILSKLPHERTDKEINYATIALRGHKLIANYPVRMQRNLAAHGAFESFDCKRVIVRQGHPPQGFYYILYGECIVAVLGPSDLKAKTVCILERGDSFGELSILHRTNRQSTVITKTYSEFLCITPKVYKKVFMVGGVRNINDPDHSTFIKSIAFLAGWPINILSEQTDPKMFVFLYTQRGEVIVRDSNYSNKIIIVKSGSCLILKKLQRVTPYIDSLTGKLKKVINPSRDDRHGFCGFSLVNSQPGACHSKLNSIDGVVEANKLNVDGKARSDTRLKIRPHSAFPCVSDRTGVNVRKAKPMPARPIKNVSGKTHQARSSEQIETAKESPRFTPRKRTFLDDLDDGFQEKDDRITAADRSPEFVKVQTLTKGGVFGLASMIHGDQASLCLVSNGAECIIMDKKLYRENCPQDLWRKMKTEVSPYPTDQEMQENLKIRVNWDAYKQSNVNKIICDIQNLKVRHNYSSMERPLSA